MILQSLVCAIMGSLLECSPNFLRGHNLNLAAVFRNVFIVYLSSKYPAPPEGLNEQEQRK